MEKTEDRQAGRQEGVQVSGKTIGWTIINSLRHLLESENLNPSRFSILDPVAGFEIRNHSTASQGADPDTQPGVRGGNESDYLFLRRKSRLKTL